MQLVSGDKFKFFPVKFGTVIVPLGNIKTIFSRSVDAENPMVEIKTYSEEVYTSKISEQEAQAIWEKAFKECEY